MVVWLVRNHLIMSDTSQRRDVFDPKTARDLAGEIKTRERLRLLLVLTVADIRAVGPGTWTAWKGQLLESLFREVEARLGGAAPNAERASRVHAVQDALRENLPGWSDVAFARVVSLFDESYWLGVPAEHHARHVRLLAYAEHRVATGRPVYLVDQAADQGLTRVTVIAQDKPGLFASLAGVFAAYGAYIISASAFTSAQGLVLDIFELQAPQKPSSGAVERFVRLRERVRKVLDGSLPLEALEEPGPLTDERQQAFTVPVVTHFDNEASVTYTVLEVERPQGSGFLYQITFALRELGLSIGSAHCTHYGELAVDVFYLKDRGGLKIVRPTTLEKIEQRVVSVLTDAISNGD
jgi:[protein-PII] uridylyltransferase